MKKIIMSRIFIVVITAIICISGTVFAATKFQANEIGYKGTTVDKALDDLYGKANSRIIVCALLDGTSKQVGAKYDCDPGDGIHRTFYVLKVNSNDIDLIMDRNITDTILVNNSKLLDWNSAIHFFDEGNPGYSITGAWDNVISISLPSIQDIADAGGITNFNYETDSNCAFFGASNLNDASKKTNYIWLYDYSRACSNHGCTNSLPDIDGYPFGYWTLDSVANNSNNAWIVGRGGRTDILNKSEESLGVRPVIKV